ncbi:hypothetical protein D3C77_387760 [compost metagenome]
MTIKNKPTTEISATKIRLIAAALVPTMLLTGVFSIYWLWTNVLPIYGRIYRNAPVIEVPYLAFGLLMAPPAVIIFVIGSAIAVWTGKKFDPARSSKLYRFQNLMFSASVKIITYVVPTLMILTTLTLLARDYSPCPKLLISGSAWQLFWVNDERACFKPSRYINGNWPCKVVGDREICIQVDEQ